MQDLMKKLIWVVIEKNYREKGDNYGNYKYVQLKGWSRQNNINP